MLLVFQSAHTQSYPKQKHLAIFVTLFVYNIPPSNYVIILLQSLLNYYVSDSLISWSD